MAGGALSLGSLDEVHVDVRRSPGATLFSVVRNVLGGTSSGVPASWSRAVRGALPAGAAVVRPLLDDDWQLVADKTGATRLGFCLLLMFFELDARFPRHAGEIPKAAVEYVAGQVKVDPAVFADYQWSGSTIKYHRKQIREARRSRPARSARSSKARNASPGAPIPTPWARRRPQYFSAKPDTERTPAAVLPSPGMPSARDRKQRLFTTIKAARSAAAGQLSKEATPRRARHSPLPGAERLR
ncbi:hypothetical protein FHU36_004441 [Nonomuraea muscovyensis]|uniref:DUF4158 domain-containing protein n=1 Tax=Nonomuraea muscovyensis TaxID=1124761 RepID=A0A7X0C597_9ACTN|nr:DUF4158 domain-containing protein [Nonomuraea muscovyensis]MBB6347896.1 hypothetical protein [Nonomuraea muscovyensis]